MSVGDAYRLELRQNYSSQNLMNTLAFDRKAESAPTQAECLALANSWATALKPHQMSGLTYTTWIVQQISGSGVTYGASTCRREGGLRFEGLFTAPSFGAQTGDGMPPQCAVVTTLGTGISGRRRRGRYYMAGFGENIQNGGTIAGTPVTDMQTSWTAQLAKYIGTGTDLVWRLGVWSQTTATGCKPGVNHPHTPTQVASPNPGDAFRPVSSVVVKNIVYTQRRRTIGVGS